jgi:hypothetical protein
MNLRTAMSWLTEDLVSSAERSGVSVGIDGLRVTLRDRDEIAAWLDLHDDELLSEEQRRRRALVESGGGEIG